MTGYALGAKVDDAKCARCAMDDADDDGCVLCDDGSVCWTHDDADANA